MIIIKLFHINFYYTRDNVLSALVLHFYSALFFIYTYCNKKEKSYDSPFSYTRKGRREAEERRLTRSIYSLDIQEFCNLHERPSALGIPNITTSDSVMLKSCSGYQMCTVPHGFTFSKDESDFKASGTQTHLQDHTPLISDISLLSDSLAIESLPSCLYSLS